MRAQYFNGLHIGGGRRRGISDGFPPDGVEELVEQPDQQRAHGLCVVSVKGFARHRAVRAQHRGQCCNMASAGLDDIGKLIVEGNEPMPGIITRINTRISTG